MISNSRFHRGRNPYRLMNPAEIVPNDVRAECSPEIFQLRLCFGLESVAAVAVSLGSRFSINNAQKTTGQVERSGFDK